MQVPEASTARRLHNEVTYGGLGEDHGKNPSAAGNVRLKRSIARSIARDGIFRINSQSHNLVRTPKAELWDWVFINSKNPTHINGWQLTEISGPQPETKGFG